MCRARVAELNALGFTHEELIDAAELRRLSQGGDELACYVVEVCPGCSWNHLARSFVVPPVKQRRRSAPSA